MKTPFGRGLLLILRLNLNKGNYKANARSRQEGGQNAQGFFGRVRVDSVLRAFLMDIGAASAIVLINGAAPAVGSLRPSAAVSTKEKTP
jgi:hypothetical protein